MDAASLAGVHDQHGWLWETPEDGQGGGGSVWDRWGQNLQASKDELWEVHTAWSKRDEDPEYSNFTIGTNAAMMTAGLPLKFANTLLGLGPGGSVTTPTPSDGSFSGPDGPRSGRGPGSSEWPNSPLPDDRPGSAAPTTERFSDQLTHLRESLLDPHQHRGDPSPPPGGPSPGPDRPTPTDRGDHPSPDPTTPHRGDSSTQDNNTPPTRPRDDTRDQNTTPPTRPRDNDSSPRNGQDDGRPRRRDNNSSGDQSNSRTGRGDDNQQGGTRPREDQRQPDPATSGGRGDDGGNQPPRDRTGTGDDNGRDGNDNDRDGSTDREDSRGESGNDNTNDSQSKDPREPTNPAPAEKVINDLRDFRSRRMIYGNSVFTLDRSAMKHILTRHHPEYWNGTKKTEQSFFDKKMSINDIADAVQEVMNQNRERIVRNEPADRHNLFGEMNGEVYQLGAKLGRVGQFYPVYQ